MIRFIYRVCYFVRWVYQPVHGEPSPPAGDGKVFRLKPSAAWDLAGRFAGDHFGGGRSDGTWAVVKAGRPRS